MHLVSLLIPLPVALLITPTGAHCLVLDHRLPLQWFWTLEDLGIGKALFVK